MFLVAEIIHRVIQLIMVAVVVQVILSYFMSPFDPIRRTLDRLLNPLLAPIRRVVPPIGMLDFSPLILIILLQVLDVLIQRLLYSFS